MARAGRGDRLAASALIIRHTDRILAVAYRMLGDRGAAEDVAQETFVRLWRNAADWKPGVARLETWLYRVASNLCIDRIRKSKRDAPEDAAPEQVDDAPLADGVMEATERGAAVRAAIARLNERQRMALTLCHYEELSNGETAEIMGVSVEAVESLLARARRRLRDLLLADDPDIVEVRR